MSPKYLKYEVYSQIGHEHSLLVKQCKYKKQPLKGESLPSNEDLTDHEKEHKRVLPQKVEENENN